MKKRHPGRGGDGVVRDQPPHGVHGLPPPARPLADQEEANRLQAACRGGGSSYSADQSLLRNTHLDYHTDVSQNITVFIGPRYTWGPIYGSEWLN